MLFLAAGLPFLLRFVVASMDLEHLTKASPLLEDDLFYCLSIARSWVAGHGLTTDGVTATTGFQWVHLLICAGLVKLCGSADLTVHVLLYLQVAATIVVGVLLYRLTCRLGRVRAAWIAVLLYSWSLATFRHGNNGLETPWSSVITLLLPLILLVPPQSTRHRRLALFGISTLAAAVRIDLVALPLCLAIALLPRRESRRSALILGVGALLGLLLVFAANLAVNGHAMPDGGVAVRKLAIAYRGPDSPDVHLLARGVRLVRSVARDQPMTQLAGGLGASADPAFYAGGLATLALLVCGFLSIVRQVGSREIRGTVVGSIAPLAMGVALFVALLVAFYLVVLPVWWFWPRYLYPATLCSLPILAMGLTTASRALPRAAALSAGLLCLGLFARPAVDRVRAFKRSLATVPLAADRDRLLDLAAVCHNYDLARWVGLHIPANERIAMWQGGQIAWQADRPVVYLDGVVNREALEAWNTGRVAEYLRSQRVDWLVDYESLTRFAVAHAGEGDSSLVWVASSTCASSAYSVSLYHVSR